MTQAGHNMTDPGTSLVLRAVLNGRRRLLAARLLAAVCVCLSLSYSAHGQDVQFTQGSVSSGLDNTVQISLASYPGRGATGLPVTLYYSSKVWRVGYIRSVRENSGIYTITRPVAEAIYAEHSASGWTTSLDVPRVEWPRQDDVYWYDGKPYHSSVGPYTYRVARVFIHLADGSSHELRRADAVYADAGVVEKSGVYYAVDGSRLRYDADAAVLYMPDGARYEMGDDAVVRLIDRNGNALTYDRATRNWSDSLGHDLRGNIPVPLPANPQAGDYAYQPPGFAAPYVFKWKYLSQVLTPDAQGQTPSLRTLSSHYLPTPGQQPTSQGGSNFPQPVGAGVPTLFFSSGPSEDSDSMTYVVGRGQVQAQPFNPVVLAEVVLPNSTADNVVSYKFTYNVYGEIDRIVYPTGAYERCQYDAVPAMGRVSGPYDQASRGVKSRWVSPNGTGGADESQWRYEPSVVPYTLAYLVKVTAPDGTRSDTYKHNAPGGSFGYEDARNGVVEEERVYDKDPDLGGVMLRRTLTEWAQAEATYQHVTPTSPSRTITYKAYRNPRPVKSLSLILDAGDALAKRVTYEYDTTYEFTTGIDRTVMTESGFASVNQTTARADATTARTLSDAYAFPAASTSVTEYLNGQTYRDRYILGLVSSVTLLDAAGQPVSKTETFYDEADFPLIAYGDLGADPAYAEPATQARANPTTVRRYVDAAASVAQGQECPAGVCLETHARFDQYGNPVYFWDERAAAPFVEGNASTRKDYSAAYRHAYLTGTTSIAPDPTGQHGSSAPFTSSTTYEAATGLVLSMTDANGQATTFSYDIDPTHRDPLNRPRRVTRPDGSWTKTFYNDVPGNVYVHTESQLDAARSTHAYQFYDRLGRATRSFARELGSNYVVTETRYDRMGRVSQTSNPVRTTVAGTGDPSQAAYWATTVQPAFWTATDYDALGRARKVTQPDGTFLTTEYAGVYTTVTDQAGKKRRQKTDAQGHVIRVDEPDANGDLDAGDKDAPTQPSFYEYDTLGNVVRISQGLAQAGAAPESAASYTQHRYFKYDALSRLTHEKQAEQAGTISAADPLTANPAWSRRLAYDETLTDEGGNLVSYRGLLTTAEDARHVVTNFYYDRAGRTYRLTYSDGTPAVTSRYDQARTDAPAAGEQAVAFHNKGRLTELTTAQTSEAPQTQQLYDYDLMGRTRRQRQVVGAVAYELRYEYNLGGGLVSERYPSGRKVSYGYDDAGRLLTVGGGATAYASAMTYKPFGGLESMTLGNGAVYTMAYTDATLQLSSVSLTQGASVLQKYEYRYGAVDMATGAVDGSKNNGQIARIEGTVGAQRLWQQRFSYDSLGRLASAGEYYGDALQNRSYLLSYDYDVYGNRYQKAARNQNNAVAQSWVEDGAYSATTNRLGAGLVYDDAGNVTQDSRFRQRKIQYDANNRQRRSSNLDDTGAVQSIYDGAGQRVASASGGQVTAVMVYDAAGDLVAEYGVGASGGGTQYVMGDHQGSTRVTMHGAPVNGQLVAARQDYLPFGEEVPGTVGARAGVAGYGQPPAPRQKYAGMEAGDSTGESHTLWREYDSLSARWAAPDPYGGSMELASPQTFNRYAYCNSDPVNKVDPAGLMLSDIGVYQTWNPQAARGLDYQSVINHTYAQNHSRQQQARQTSTQRNNAAFVRRIAAAGVAPLAGAFWPPSTHDQIIDEALPGLTSEEKRAVQRGSRDVDLFMGVIPTTLEPAEAYKHAMVPGPWVNLYGAERATKMAQEAATKFIEDQIADAQKHVKEYREETQSRDYAMSKWYEAHFSFGRAIHTIMDGHSPAHGPWGVYFFTGSPTDILFAEIHGRSESGPPTAAQMAAMVADIRSQYHRIVREEQYQKAITRPK
ncbi:MAG TPA: RHS repeat-associated core domain-containing protein [Pyrinomonadaceae bacterium]|jgi:RHS repeat-associated protein